MPLPYRDESRRQVAARGLTPDAVALLTRDALGAIDLAALAPVKGLLKRFFSTEPWTAADDDALAALVGPGTGWWRHTLADRYEFEFGWRDAAFRMDLGLASPLEATFGGPVVPEATPNPRTIRFVTPPIHDGPSRWYESAADVDDARVARLFADFDDVANVLLGPAFVAVGLRRPERWEELLDPMLRTITAEFASGDRVEAPGTPIDIGAPAASNAREPQHERSNDLARAWKDLGSLRPDDPEDLQRIVTALSASDRADRQVAARLLAGAPAETAEPAWNRLLDDPSRAVRRAAVDAMVDAERPALRPLFERALHDTDAWTRWKALRGLVDLGVAPSRAAVAPLLDDPDFRVRLEAARACSALS